MTFPPTWKTISTESLGWGGCFGHKGVAINMVTEDKKPLRRWDLLHHLIEEMPFNVADLIWEELACHLTPARLQPLRGWGGVGGGREEGQGIHILSFFSFFPLNKCHFLRQRRNRDHFRYPLLRGRLLPQVPSLTPETLIHFPNPFLHCFE